MALADQIEVMPMNFQNRFISLAVALTTATIMLLLGACSSDASPAEASFPQAIVARPTVTKVHDSRRYPGVAEAINRAILRPRVAGHLEEIVFREGTLVDKGDILFRIDSRHYLAQLEDAEAALAIARAKAQLAKSEAARALRLVDKKAISIEEAERRQADATMTEAQIRAAQAAVKAAQIDLDYTTIRAPFTGRIGRASATVGNLVTPEDELAVIVAIDELHIRFDMDETALLQLGISSTDDWFVNFSVSGIDVQWRGPLEIIGNEIRKGSGSVSLHARIPNMGHRLLPGMFGEAELVTGTRDTLLIDDRAVGTNQRQRYVLIVNDQGAVEYRPITIGGLHGNLREITSGLSVTDRIVTNDLMRIRPGSMVEPVELSNDALAGKTSASAVF